MAQIDIRLTARVLGDKELVAALQRMSAQDIPKAVKHGVKIAARGGRTTLAKEVGQRYSLSAGRIKQDVSQPTYRDGGQTAIIRTSRKPITAMQYKAKETAKGLSLAIFKGQRSIVKGGFIAKGLPFKRKGQARMPLRVVHGPSIHAIYSGGKHKGAIQQATEQRIEEQLQNGIVQGIKKVSAGFVR